MKQLRKGESGDTDSQPGDLTEEAILSQQRKALVTKVKLSTTHIDRSKASPSITECGLFL